MLVKDYEYVGYISANIYNDRTSSLIMSGIRNIDLLNIPLLEV